MRSYSVTSVERLLRNYFDFRYNLLDGGSGHSTAASAEDCVAPAQAAPELITRRRPFGWTKSDQRWPFMEPRHARSKVDGKRKAQLMTDIHVSVLDLERGLKALSDDDLEIVYKRYLFQTRTLDEMCVERNVASRGSMQRRCVRALERLTGWMNDPSLWRT